MKSLPYMSGGVVTKIDIPKAFKVYAVCYGGGCSKLWVSNSGGLYCCRADALHPKRSDTEYPHHVVNATICPHCTSKKNWKRASAFAQGSPKIGRGRVHSSGPGARRFESEVVQ